MKRERRRAEDANRKVSEDGVRAPPKENLHLLEGKVKKSEREGGVSAPSSTSCRRRKGDGDGHTEDFSNSFRKDRLGKKRGEGAGKGCPFEGLFGRIEGETIARDTFPPDQERTPEGMEEKDLLVSETDRKSRKKEIFQKERESVGGRQEIPPERKVTIFSKKDPLQRISSVGECPWTREVRRNTMSVKKGEIKERSTSKRR